MRDIRFSYLSSVIPIPVAFVELSLMRIRQSEIQSALRSVEASKRFSGERSFVRLSEVEITALAPCAAESLPIMQKVALIQMMASPFKGILIGAMAAAEHIQDRPSIVDYHAPVERGWAEKRDGEKYHSLTYEGRSQAERLSQSLCKTYNIHRLIEVGGGGLREVTFKCPCGWRTHIAKGNFVETNARARFCAHLPEREAPSIIPDGG